MDGGMLAFTITPFTKKLFSLFASAWFAVRYFSFVKQTVLYFFFLCLQMVAFDTFSMTSSLIFRNNFFLQLDADSSS